MTRTLYLLRAMRADDVSLHLADVLTRAIGRPVVFVCDESRGRADTGIYDKLPLTGTVLRDLGFRNPPGNWGWFWGDLCYAAALARYPDFDAYCMMESDVFLSAAGAHDLVAALDACPAEAVAGRLRRYDSPQKYSRGLVQLGLDPQWGCIFPVSRLSARAARAMGDLRREAIDRCPGERINDEGVLVGAVQRSGLSHAALEDVAPAQVSGDSFETNPPHLFEALTARGDGETRLFHPVVARDVVLRRIENGEKNYNRHRLRKILRMADAADRAAIEAALSARG